ARFARFSGFGGFSRFAGSVGSRGSGGSRASRTANLELANLANPKNPENRANLANFANLASNTPDRTLLGARCHPLRADTISRRRERDDSSRDVVRGARPGRREAATVLLGTLRMEDRR